MPTPVSPVYYGISAIPVGDMVQWIVGKIL